MVLKTKGSLNIKDFEKKFSKTIKKHWNFQVSFEGNSTRRGISLMQIAKYNFFGTKRIVARNPLNFVNAKGIHKVKNFQLAFFPLSKKSAKAVKAVEKFLCLKVQKAFFSPFEPNKPSTVKRKGFNLPLIWSGKLKNSVRVSLKRGKK